MAKAATLNVRVDSEAKRLAEGVCDELGTSISNVVNMFIHAIAREQRIPLDMNLRKSGPIVFSELSEGEFSYEIEKGFADIDNGRTFLAGDVKNRLNKEYGI